MKVLVLTGRFGMGHASAEEGLLAEEEPDVVISRLPVAAKYMGSSMKAWRRRKTC